MDLYALPCSLNGVKSSKVWAIYLGEILLATNDSSSVVVNLILLTLPDGAQIATMSLRGKVQIGAKLVTIRRSN